MKWRISPGTIGGTVSVPGDKSIAHRAIMLASLASGTSTIKNLPNGDDVRSTVRCLRVLGVSVEIDGNSAYLESSGRLSEPSGPLDAGNSGTTMRLLAGILAGQPFASHLCGDPSLSRRPMSRVAEPLRLMGAIVRTADGKPPLDIEGGPLHGIRYTLPVASAQVKSAVLLAALFAEGRTEVIEPARTRDHTECLLRATGVEVVTQDGTIQVGGGRRPSPFDTQLPGDLSSAAFLLAGAVLTGGEVTVRALGVNPTRTAFLDVLEQMGARVDVVNARRHMEEPVGDVTVSGSVTEPIEIGGADVAPLIDELPLVALLATQARGTTVVRDAAELRVKETDRIAAVTAALSVLGGDMTQLQDGFVVRGPTPLTGARIQSPGDHRLAMLLAVAGAAASGGTVVEGAEAAMVSFPTFEAVFRRLGGTLHAS